MKRFLRGFAYAFNGLATAWREEVNFRLELIVALLVLAWVVYFDYTALEIGLITGAIVIVLFSELVNTAIEDLCNKVEPAEDPIIKKVKDLMAGAVFVSAFGALALGTTAFIHHFL